MLVYGDAVRRETAGEKLARIQDYLGRAGSAEPWVVRHGWSVAALIEAGELAQGIADRAFEAHGSRDVRGAEAGCAMELTLALARAVGSSWRGFDVQLAPVYGAIARLGEVAPDGDLAIKLPEGFGHYALYPETYFEAALPLAGRDADVIGIRSIGTTLAAMVAAAIEAPCPATVRPVGHPFGRELALVEGEGLGLRPHAELAIVDEGPGLSGSSIVAVAEAAGREGVGPDRIHVFPSHRNGPGPKAGETAQRFWRSARVSVRSFDDLALGRDRHRRLESWFADLIGEPTAPTREISGGVWRGLRFGSPADWPPVHAWQERRKFLVETASGTWLLKFAGLGRIGLDKFEKAQALAMAGFATAPLGFRHGFTVEPWHQAATALDPFGPTRERFLAHLGAYLRFRVHRFPAEPDRGASAEQLLVMLRANVEEEFGPDSIAPLERWRTRLASLSATAVRVATDNRLHAWEWLVLPSGEILKTDAVDHHVGHDLVGCQDLAWDIAGASVEFRLSQEEQEALIEQTEHRGVGVCPDRVRFLTLCYPAFQLGYYREAAASASDDREAVRLRGRAELYAATLRRSLASSDQAKGMAS